MKICPFISHMIGEDRAGVLEIPSGGDSAQPQGAAGAETKAATKGEAPSTSHLFCMKETCRFYRKQGGECSFDAMFDQVEAQVRAAKSQKTTATITKELDKFWKFQTKSVAELISSFGESDQKHKTAIEKLERELGAKLEKMVDTKENDKLGAINDALSKLRAATESREEGMEELSSTVSQMVMTFEDSLSEIRKQSGQLAERIDKLESSIPRIDSIRDLITESLESSGAKEVPGEVRSVRDRFESFVDSSSKFETTLREWQERLDSRVDEIRDAQSEWMERLESIAESRRKEEAAPEPSPERRKKARNLNNLGVTSFHNGELELARDQFRQAIALDEGFAECYNNLGLVLTELGEEESATEAFSTAIKINPDLHAAYNNLGYVFYKQGSYEQAIEMYNEALGRSASNTSAYTNLGNAYYKQNKFDQARAAWEKALELDPSNRKAARSLKEMERAVR